MELNHSVKMPNATDQMTDQMTEQTADPATNPVTNPATNPVTDQATDQTAQDHADVLDNLSRDLFVRHHQNARKREQGMMVRLGEEVGLPPEVAGQYGSEIQGKMPHGFSGYDRSGASSS